MSAPGIGAMRTVVANPGEIDRKFIALAAGVVVLAAGAAIAVPSAISLLGGNVRPIEQVVAGLDRAGARTALAAEAFPDADGQAFMTSLAANLPREHSRLLDTLADTAMAGGDRDGLPEVEAVREGVPEPDALPEPLNAPDDVMLGEKEKDDVELAL
jgi:hypothetical protein